MVLAFVDKPHIFQRPINFGKSILFLSILGIAVASIVKGCDDSYQQDRSNKIIDSLKLDSDSLKSTADSIQDASENQTHLIEVQTSLIDSLRSESHTAAVEYQDSLKNYHYYTTDLLGKYGLKVDTLRGEVSTIRTMPNTAGHMGLPVPIICTVTESGDTVSVNAFIKNDGTGPVYGLKAETFLFFVVDDKSYRLDHAAFPQREDYDLPINTMAGLYHEEILSKEILQRAQGYMLIVTGHYYTDYERKNFRKLGLGITYYKQFNRYGPYTKSIDSLLLFRKSRR